MIAVFNGVSILVGQNHAWRLLLILHDSQSWCCQIEKQDDAEQHADNPCPDLIHGLFLLHT